MSLVIHTNEWRYAYPGSCDLSTILVAFFREVYRVVSYKPQDSEFAVIRFNKSHLNIPCERCDGNDDECAECMRTVDMEEDDETAEQWALNFRIGDEIERENAAVILRAMARAETLRPVAQEEVAA